MAPHGCGVVVPNPLPREVPDVSSTPASSRVQTRELSALRPHPNQANLWGDLPEAELVALAESIKRFGLRQPIEVTEAGLVVDGHQRIRAAERLGLTEIACVVVPDDQVDELHLSLNLLRRQLGPLAKARAIKALAEHHALQQRRRNRPDCGPVDLATSVQLREQLAQELGCSARTVARHLALLRTARPIQDAVDRGELPFTLALRVSTLSAEDQDTVSREIQAGGPAKKIVKEAIEAAVEEQDVEDVEDDDVDVEAGVYRWLVEVLAKFDADALVGSAPLESKELLLVLESGVQFFQRLLALESQAQQESLRA